MSKAILSACGIAILSLFMVGCGNDIKKACEHMNDLCSSEENYMKMDCDAVEKLYDNQSDSEKDKADKNADCVLDKKSCEEAMKCGRE